MQHASGTFFLRSELVAVLDYGKRVLAIARDGSARHDHEHYPCRIIDAQNLAVTDLGKLAYLPGPTPQERYGEILDQLPAALHGLAAGSLLNPEVSGSDREIRFLPRRVAGAARGRRAAVVLGGPGTAGYRLRIIDCETLEVLHDIDPTLPQVGPIPSDRGIWDVALSGDGESVAMTRCELRISGKPQRRFWTTFHGELGGPPSFHLEDFYSADDPEPAAPKLAWCDDRWLVARRRSGSWSLLVLNAQGQVVDSFPLDEAPMLMQAAVAAPRVALLSESDRLEVIDLDSRERHVCLPQSSQGYPAVAVAPNGSWTAFHDSGNGRVEAWIWQRDEPVLLDPLPKNETRLEDGQVLTSIPGLVISEGGLLSLVETKPELRPLPFET